MKFTAFLLILGLPVLLAAQEAGIPPKWSPADSLDAARVADSLALVAQNHSAEQAFDRALEVINEAENFVLSKFGQNSVKYSNVLNQKGIVYFLIYNFPEAEKYWLQVRDIRAKVLGKSHSEYCGILVNLGAMYQYAGQYEQAETCYLEAKNIFENQLHVKDSDNWYFNCVANLGTLYSLMGNFDKAESVFLDILERRRKSNKVSDTDFAGDLNNLSYVYSAQGKFEKAQSLQREALSIYERAVGKQHAKYADMLGNIANDCMDMGQTKEAFPLYQEAVTIIEHALGKEHPRYAECLDALGEAYLSVGQYEKAEPLLSEATARIAKGMGKANPAYGKILFNLAALYLEMGSYEKAIPLYVELSTLNQAQLAKSLQHLSEVELGRYAATFADVQKQSLQLLQRSNDARLAVACYDNSLFYKGLLLHANTQIRRIARENPAASKILNEIIALRRHLADEYTLPVDERDSSNVVRMEEQANDLEKGLARAVAGFAVAIREVRSQDVQAALKPGESSIEFVNYAISDKKQSLGEMYAALILLPDGQPPAFIPLFEEKQLDSLLKSSGERKADYVNGLYTLADRGASVVGKPLKTLYELLWQPLEKELAGATTVYFSPSGLLHRLNLGAIPLSDDQTLADKYSLVQMKSTRQLVVTDDPKIAGNDAVLYGGIQFDRDSTSWTPAGGAELAYQSRGLDPGYGFFSVDSSLRASYPISNPGVEKKAKPGKQSKKGKKQAEVTRGGMWSFLPGTEKEIGAVEKILLAAGFAPTTKKGNDAAEEYFKSLGQSGKPSPRILHLATHGYFFSDPKTDHRQHAGDKDQSVFKLSDHPMLRSGLILAGGNAAWQGAKTLEGREDGVLTAYEISQMNLSNTELVVLSACETGLGDIAGNEGVYGLQRAFKIAGAKYLIMSLWQVPDKQTSMLMTTFYKKWLEQKMNIPDAFHAAQKELRDIGLDPYQWAGFVLVE